jgi:hypothetical protein
VFTVTTGDSIRLANGVVFRVDRDGRLQAFDGSASTQKLMATRGTGGLDIAAIASKMTPLGTLSARGTARGAFQTTMPGGIMMIDYGRPLVRERTVWGGLLIPADTIWRLGANEATHFATSRELDFNGILVPPGLYTLFLFKCEERPAARRQQAGRSVGNDLRLGERSRANSADDVPDTGTRRGVHDRHPAISAESRFTRVRVGPADGDGDFHCEVAAVTQR